jgi:prepilin-type N-terminal cleavage/methylation domain-containing protein/prepilin-type processing-associated H-X9-DG protein
MKFKLQLMTTAGEGRALNRAGAFTFRGGAASAFTLIEMMVVLVIIGLLAGLVLPTLSRAVGKARTIACLNNKRQLQLAWLVYPGDHNDRLVPHGLNIPAPPQPELGLWWAQGFMNYDGGNSENTNTLLLVNSDYAQLGPYTKNPAIYKCPEDKSQVRTGRSKFEPRVRSVSMNGFIGSIAQCGTDDMRAIGVQRLSAIQAPSELFVFIDEHPDSLDFVSFWVSDWGVGRSGPGTFWHTGLAMVSYPSPLHRGGATLSFADGHVELRVWKDERTRPPVSYAKRLPGGVSSPGNEDILWLQKRTYSHQNGTR